MAIRIPDLYQSNLVIASFCGYATERSSATAREIVRDIGEIEFDFNLDIGNSRHRISFATEIDSDDDVHVHVNLARMEILNEESLPEQSGSIDEMSEALEKLDGCAIELASSGTYRLDWANLQQGGLIHGMSGISAETSGLTFSLTGGEIAISGDSPFRRITWKKTESRLRGEISARTPTKISESYLVDAVKLLEGGVRRFVLEQEPTQ